MRLLLIAYALRTPLKNYSGFYNAIKTNSAHWWHFLNSMFIVSTYHDANEFAQFLYPHMNKSDSLLVIRIQPEFQGWLPKDAWDWFEDKDF